MNSVMRHQFSRVPNAEIQRSAFDRSHGYKTTFDAGYLIPFYVDEALPGDSFHLKVSAFARLATPLKPIMDNMFMETFFFAVPYRLVWDNWERFNGAQDNPDDSTDFLVPQFDLGATLVSTGSLSDYMGIPIETSGLKFSSLWHRAANLIWNQWFRDENLQDSLVVDKDDGPDTYGDYVLQRRGKRHDYFTSALPFPQKGPDVLLPLGTTAPVVGTGGNYSLPGFDIQFNDATLGSGTALTVMGTGGGPNDLYNATNASTSFFGYKPGQNIDYSDFAANLTADLSLATSATINAIREAFQLQRMYERDARGGTRYTEILKAHFRVTSPDARLQRAEYLGGGSSPVNIHPVAQTSEGVTETPQGNLAAFGTASFSGHGFSKSFTEHCLILGFVSVRADLTYQQGLDRKWSRRTRFDFYWPALSHLGEQEVLQQEIFASGVDAEDETIFGYQERYAEYRYFPSHITGLFRSNTPGGSLDVWHLSQDFATAPTLSPEFIEENPPIDRVIAVPSEPHFLFDSYLKLKCVRPMPVYGVPGMVDHF